MSVTDRPLLRLQRISQWPSGNMPDCGVRGPRFESHRRRLCLSRQPLREFTRFIWWMQTQRQGGRQPPDQANWLGLWVRRKAATVHIHHRHFIITQPLSWYSFYRPAEGGRLSRPRHCSKGVQPVPKAVYGSGCRDKHNCPRWDSNLGLLTPQPDILPLGHCDTAVPMPLNDLESHFSCLKPF